MTKIAFPTDDGQTISQHFGMASYFVVASLPDGQEPAFEQRPKAHHSSHDHSHGEHDHQQGVGAQMFTPLSDCQVLIAGGMGQPAYDRAVQQGLQVFLTSERTIPAALAAYQAGQLQSDPRRIHQH